MEWFKGSDLDAMRIAAIMQVLVDKGVVTPEEVETKMIEFADAWQIEHWSVEDEVAS